MAAASRVPVYVASRVRGLVACVQSLLPGVQIHEVPVNEKGVILQERVGQSLLSSCEVLLCDPCVIVQMATQRVEDITRAVREQKVAVKFAVSRTGEGFGQLLGEYVVGYIIAIERKFHAMHRTQLGKQWDVSFKVFRPLTDVTVGILGLGSIGKEVARMCKGMGMAVWGLSRGAGSPSSSCQHVDQTTTDLGDLLSNCDYVCNVLPSTHDTRNLLSGDILERCQNKKSVFINVGRGDVVTEDCLVDALKHRWLGGAVLDVFHEEPLPETSPLWNMDNVFVTPHMAGPSQTSQVSAGFVHNYQLYCNGKQLKYEVDWDKGY